MVFLSNADDRWKTYGFSLLNQYDDIRITTKKRIADAMRPGHETSGRTASTTRARGSKKRERKKKGRETGRPVPGRGSGRSFAARIRISYGFDLRTRGLIYLRARPGSSEELMAWNIMPRRNGQKVGGWNRPFLMARSRKYTNAGGIVTGPGGCGTAGVGGGYQIARNRRRRRTPTVCTLNIVERNTIAR